MISMTGYASKEVSNEQFTLYLELKSYNNRYTEIKHNIPGFLSCFEMEMDRRIKKSVKRGSVELSIRLKQLSNNISLSVDTEAIEKYADAYETIAKRAQVPFTVGLQDYINSEGIINYIHGSDAEPYEESVFSTLDEVLEQFNRSREKEGKALESHIRSLLDSMSTSLQSIGAYSGTIESRLKETLLKKIEDVMGSREYDENRYLQEVALLLVKYSIQEELIRLETHLGAFKQMVKESGPVGKRLDFLCQEMNREINTIGSKSMIVEVNHLVVSMKDDLENIREQIRNIE
ncbi:MAG: YicC family protein [Sphaerochaetaceae bacterium]|nr:YicC family protein [Sphaerochaetaceae bacterium]